MSKQSGLDWLGRPALHTFTSAVSDSTYRALAPGQYVPLPEIINPRQPAYVRSDQAQKIAKEWAATRGWYGKAGGWIYTASGQVIMQGWFNIWSRYRMQILDWLTARLTAFETLSEMLNTSPNYRPTILPSDFRYSLLADAYDVAQERRGDARRAWRGSRA